MSPKSEKKRIWWIVPPLFWLGVWQIAAMMVGQELLLPAPLSVLRVLAGLAVTGEFWLSALSTLGRVFGGLLAGSVMGAALAVATWRFSWAQRLLAPAVGVVRAAPVVCFILLLYLWVAREHIPGAVAALMVLPVMWGNVDAGLRAVPGEWKELARAYRFSPWKAARLIYLPALRPYGVSGFLTSLGLAWKSGVAAEVICPPRSAIGTRITAARTALETAELFAWTLVIISLSLALERLFRRLLSGKGVGA